MGGRSVYLSMADAAATAAVLSKRVVSEMYDCLYDFLLEPLFLAPLGHKKKIRRRRNVVIRLAASWGLVSRPRMRKKKKVLSKRKIDYLENELRRLKDQMSAINTSRGQSTTQDGDRRPSSRHVPGPSTPLPPPPPPPPPPALPSVTMAITPKQVAKTLPLSNSDTSPDEMVGGVNNSFTLQDLISARSALKKVPDEEKTSQRRVENDIMTISLALKKKFKNVESPDFWRPQKLDSPEHW